MKDLLNIGHKILNAMKDIGPDVVIFSNFLHCLEFGNWEDLQHYTFNCCFERQPLQQQIYKYIRIVKEYAEYTIEKEV